MTASLEFSSGQLRFKTGGLAASNSPWLDGEVLKSSLDSVNPSRECDLVHGPASSALAKPGSRPWSREAMPASVRTVPAASGPDGEGWPWRYGSARRGATRDTTACSGRCSSPGPCACARIRQRCRSSRNLQCWSGCSEGSEQDLRSPEAQSGSPGAMLPMSRKAVVVGAVVLVRGDSTKGWGNDPGWR